MTHSQGFIDVPHTEARGSSRLYQQSWQPETDARAAILLVHGLGEHSKRYEYFARHCTQRGFAVYTLDHYGHGKSDGHPGYVERFSVFLDGVDAALINLQAQHPALPVFLVGHSMGGLIAAAYLLNRQQSVFRGCVLSGPAFITEQTPPRLLLLLNRILSLLVPTLPMAQLDATAISRDPAVVEAYANDPLVFHGKLTSRFIAEMSAAMDSTLRRAEEINIPLILLHGDQDRLTSPSGSLEFHERAASADKSIKIYPGLYHEIFNEPERDQVLEDMSTWLEAHL